MGFDYFVHGDFIIRIIACVSTDTFGAVMLRQYLFPRRELILFLISVFLCLIEFDNVVVKFLFIFNEYFSVQILFEIEFDFGVLNLK